MTVGGSASEQTGKRSPEGDGEPPERPARRIHVVTIHWLSDEWIETQARAFDRFLPANTVRWGCLNGIDRDWSHRFDRVVDLEGGHSDKLDELARLAGESADPDDLLMFIDGDALPVVPLDVDLLGGDALIAVRRDENLGDSQPHPCFCVTTFRTWDRLAGTWAGQTFTNGKGRRVHDLGGRLLALLEESGTGWRPLLRSNTVDLHPLWFGVYGGIVYHHGSGFRPPHSRVDSRVPDLVSARVPGLRRVALVKRFEAGVRFHTQVKRRLRRNERTNLEVKSWVLDGGDVLARFQPALRSEASSLSS